MEIDFRSPFRLTRRDRNYYPIRTTRLLRETHEFGARYVRELRAEFGTPIIDRALRKRLIMKVPIDGGEVVILDKEGRRELGIRADGRVPSPDALMQRTVTARVVRYLHYREDLRYEARRKPHITVMRDPAGYQIVVLTKLENYRSASLKRLLSQSLSDFILQPRTRILLYARPTKYMDKIVHEYSYVLELRDIRPYLLR